jgi:hypothetical protein
MPASSMRVAAAPGTFGRDASAPSFFDEAHLAAALAYVAPNPVRARLAARARDWRWASTRAHLSGRAAGNLITIKFQSKRFADNEDCLGGPASRPKSDRRL